MNQNTTQRPKVITYAFIVYIVSMLFTIVSASITIYYAPPENSKPILIVLFVLFLWGYLFIGKQFYDAKNWARILLAAIIVFGTISSIYDPLISQHTSVNYLQWVQYILGIMYTILLFTPSANKWYKTLNQ